MILIDTHCHLDVAEFAADRLEVLGRARRAGVAGQVIPAIHAAGWPALMALCQAEAGLYPALGMHPIYLAQHRPEHLDELRALIERERPVAIGEIGLDYFVEELDRDGQQQLFEAQLRIARDYQLPVVLHVRKAHDQVLAALRRIRVPGGIAHAFNGSAQQAQQYMELGFKFGFGGTVTYDRALNIRRLVVELPLDALVLETDAPDIPLASRRGERNSPEYLPEVAQAIAQLRGISIDEVARVTTANAEQLLEFKKWDARVHSSQGTP
ncbi:MAG TPA: TatD family hydrolase [Gammaproteobacteria bacterium]